MSILTYIIGLPLLAAIVLAFVPRNFAVIMRFVAIAATLVSAVLAIVMFAKFQTGPGVPAYQFEQQIEWVQSLGISYHVGVDGINVGWRLRRRVVRGKSRRAKRNFTSCCSS
jgi:NADH-quinone oxidoreductase subunit M